MCTALSAAGAAAAKNSVAAIETRACLCIVVLGLDRGADCARKGAIL
jgi:hypothetical protein